MCTFSVIIMLRELIDLSEHMIMNLENVSYFTLDDYINNTWFLHTGDDLKGMLTYLTYSRYFAYFSGHTKHYYKDL